MLAGEGVGTSGVGAVRVAGIGLDASPVAGAAAVAGTTAVAGSAVAGSAVAGSAMAGSAAAAGGPAVAGYAAVTDLAGAAAQVGAVHRLEEPTGASPLWARMADEAQRSLRRPVPIAADLAVTGIVMAATSASARLVLAVQATLLVSGLLFGVWKRRSSVAAQGISWYARRLVPVTAACAGSLYLLARTDARDSAAYALATSASLLLLKAAEWIVVGTARRRGVGLSRALLIGSERDVADTEYRIQLYREAGLVCAHSHVATWRPASAARSRALIGALISDHRIEHIVCTAGDAATDTLVRDVIRYAPPSVEVTVIHPRPLAAAATTRLGDAAVTCLARPGFGTDFCKRALDLVAAASLLILLSPVMALAALAVRLNDPGPAIFRQKRTGHGNRQFTIYKLRSMVNNAEELKSSVMDRNVADGLLFKAEDDPRVTRVGAVIRRFSIDELPQLFNVVRGEMSLVGPRPLPTVFDDTDLFAQIRHQLRPGITGLWQVKGANALPYDDMIDLDCSYVSTRSLGLDLRILVQTIPAVLVRRDPY